MYDVVVIGGGAAGFFAAINIREKNPRLRVALLEKSPTVLGKVRISGGGRCNVTHACFDNKTLCTYYPRGNRELLSVFNRFNPASTIEWFAGRGVKLKTEPDGRMFPVTDDSSTIVNCLLSEARKAGVEIRISTPATPVDWKDGFTIQTGENETIRSRKLLVCSGSSAALWKKLAEMGHTIVDPVPSLFTFNISDPFIEGLQGISVPHATLSLILQKEDRKAFRLNAGDITRSGPLLITHWGLSGPAVLALSSVAARVLHKLDYRFDVSLNLSGLNTEETYRQMAAFRELNRKKQIIGTPMFSIPMRWWQRIHSLCFERTDVNWSEASSAELMKLVLSLSDKVLHARGKSTFKEEFVTAGGVDRSEIDFRTMESKKVPGLYLAGEVIDIDALTGGFNFQAAWSGAWVSSEALSGSGQP